MNNEISIKEDRTGNKVDYVIILYVLILGIISIASIYVAVEHDSSSTNLTSAILSQLIWYFLGFVFAFIIMHFDSQQLWSLAIYAYGVGILLLILVLFFYSRSYSINTGAKSWFAIGPLSFQPSEVMKPAYILMLAKVVSKHNYNYMLRTTKTDWLLLGKVTLLTLPILLLLKLQHDLGTSLVFMAIFIGVVFVSGITWKIVLPFALIGGSIGTTFLALAVKSPTVLKALGFSTYQFQRITSWLSNSDTNSNAAYQQLQSIKAIGSGQIWGKGFNVSNVYVPVRESDFIFSVIGENFGFVGSALLILIYFFLIYRMIQTVFETKNIFYAYIAIGIIMMLLFHIFENIGANTKLLPLTGIPLPFISQGGSALLSNMIGIGLILSMRFHYKNYMFSGKSDFK